VSFRVDGTQILAAGLAFDPVLIFSLLDEVNAENNIPRVKLLG